MPRDYSLIAPLYDRIFNKPLAEGHQMIGELIRRYRGEIKILEVGVGSGLTLSYLPSRAEYIGIDINEKMLSLAQRKAKNLRGKKISLQIMDAEEMGFKDSQFDLVIAPSVLTAINSPLKGMREMIRVTKKGGYIVVIANLRERNSFKSEVFRMMDPITRKYLGFTTDIDYHYFTKFREIELVEQQKINTIMGISMSWFMVFRKR